MSITKFATEKANHPAFVDAATGTALDFQELETQSISLARLLRASLREGDRVSLLMDNGPSYFVASWAARRAGLRFVPINWHLGVEEAIYIVENSGSLALIASPRLVELATAIAQRVPLELTFSDGATFGPFASLGPELERQPKGPLDRQPEGIYMFYSSGTTGKPKGILRQLPGKTFGEPNGLENLMAGLFGFNADTVFYTPAPLYHAAPLGWSMGAQMLGGTSVIAPKFDAEATLQHIERYRVTHAQFVPTHFVRLLKLPPETRARYDISSLKMVVHSAAPCPVEVKEKMIEWWGPVVHEYYSMSEGGGFTHVRPEEWLRHKGTVGRPITSRLHIVDEDGHELPVGEIGHVMFETSERFEYLGDPEKTAAYFDARGWSKPGDMGWVDAEGYLYLADRASHMIISGGVNIYPQEIESVLTLHTAIRDVAVIGVPDEEYGESVKAVVELADGLEPGPDLAAEIIAFARERLAHFKCPRTVDFVSALPRLPTGKLLKREVRRRYWGDNKRQLI